jgi:hypothetical protein
MRTRTCHSLLWAVVILVLGVAAGQASAIGPGPLVSCKWATPAGDPLFGYVPTTWRPWPLSRNCPVISVPVTALHPGGAPNRLVPGTGTQPPLDMDKVR